MPCQPTPTITKLPLEGRVGSGARSGKGGGADGSGGKSVSLSVLPGPGGLAKSKSAPRRAVALILVHVAMAAHFAWWRFKGDVLTPVEPSEAAFTLEQGLVNAGFVFFVSAILLQLVFGRFMCGWACHIVALQDLCSWLLKKAGIRPHPFRSRLLMWAPLVLALYLFVWPTVKREAVWPLAQAYAPWLLDMLGRPVPFPAHGFVAHFVTDDFWATFASATVALPMLLVCCGLCVYFLGAKGFCTYGCPYGGFFTPVDRVSPGRIIVDHSKCEGCGHCTAVCTSNVRVHEEIKSHGMVVDPGCMKCLDCVSVCPNGALRYGFALPAALSKGAPAKRKEKPRRVFDLSWGEELALAAAFLGTFWSVRGAYELFPVLFAMGIAGCVSFLVFKAWRTVRGGAPVRAMGKQLRRADRVTPMGWGLVVAVVGLLILVAHTGVVTYHIVRGDRLFERVAMPKEALLSAGGADVPEERRRGAAEALAYYKVASPISRGGIALLPNGFVELNVALLHLMVGDAASAEADLRRVLASHGEQDGLVADIARVMDLQGNADGRRAMVDDALARRPEFWSVREQRAAEWMGAGRAPEVLADADAALAKIEDSWSTRVARARTHMIAAWALGAMGRNDEVFERLRTAAEIAPRHSAARAGLAMAYAQIKGDPARAVDEMRAAVSHEPGSAERRFLLGRMLLERGQAAEALEHFRVARAASNDDPRLVDAVRQMLEQSGHAVEAAAWSAR